MANDYSDLDTAYIVGGGGGGTNFVAAGDLAGSATSQTVIGLRGRPLSNLAPTTNDVLTWNGSTWIPAVAGSGFAPSSAQYITLSADASLTSERVLTAGTNISLIDSGAGAPLTINSTYTYTPTDATTLAKGIVQLAGDLGGTAASPLNLKINGTSVPAGGALVTGNSMHVSGTSAVTYSALNLAGGSGWVSGILPSANMFQATTTVSGAVRLTNDLAGTGAAPVVARVNGATYQAAGALVTGNSAYVSGVSATTYSALNLAGGSGWITGILPTTNQAPQAMAGDVSGTTAASVVNKINGVTVTGTPVAGYVLTAASGTTAAWTTGGGGGAPTTAQYVTLATDATLVNERVLAAGTNISIVDGGAGNNITINSTFAASNATSGAPGYIQLAGDFGGTATVPRVTSLQGTPLSSTGPTTGQVLGFNGTNWIPTAGAAFTAGTDLAGTASNQTVVSLTGASGIVSILANTVQNTSTAKVVSNTVQIPQLIRVNTNAVATLFTFNLSNNANNKIIVQVNCLQSTYAKMASWDLGATVSGNGGVYTVVGSVSKFANSSDPLLDADLTISGSTLLVRITSLAAGSFSFNGVFSSVVSTY